MYKYIPLVLMSSVAFSAPTKFEQCPTEAFLSQGMASTTHIKSVDLATGMVKTLSTGLSLIGGDKINGIAYNEDDQFLYGFNMNDVKLLKIGANFDAVELTMTGNVPTSFFVADIKDNVYYVYKKGFGFYEVNLDSSASDYLEMKKISGLPTNYALYDMAFHPNNGLLYSLDGNGKLIEIDLSAKTMTEVGSTGLAGAHGATYFEKTGYFFAVSNATGMIYRFDLRDLNNISSTPVEFALASPTSSNDGARCANAPIIAQNTDFGDAPDTYKTSLAENGARHYINYGNYFMGNNVDADPDAFVYPLSDDADSLDDENGISFVNTLKVDNNTKLIVEIGGGATTYLSAWLDYDLSGTFEESEKLIDAKALNAGLNTVVVNVPSNAQAGTTWMRFRTTSESVSINSYGGVTNGEVEDYQVEIFDTNYTKTYYPSSNSYVTLAFEDKWPEKADYDFNDVTINYRTVHVFENEVVNDVLTSTLVRIDIEGELKSYGADYFNGFAVHIPNLLTSEVLKDGSTSDDTAGVTIERNGLFDESAEILKDEEKAIFIVSNDLKNMFNSGCVSGFYKTEQGCDLNGEGVSFKLSIPINNAQNIPLAPFDPYIFGTTGHSRNDFFGGELIGEELEVHIINNPMTSLGDISLYGRQDDTSNGSDRYFVDSDNLPWGLLINYDWYVPASGISIIDAYPDFSSFSNSGGTTNLDWYTVENAVGNYIVTDQ